MNNQQFVSALRAEHSRILSYWLGQMFDEVHGGFYGEKTRNNQVTLEAPKGAILNGRILWSFAAAAIFNPCLEYINAAKRAFDYIVKYFYDPQNGGFYWSLNPDGSPRDTKKQAYAQGFILYGLTEYYRLTNDERALALAQETFDIMEKHFRDQQYGGYIEALAADWSSLNDVRLSVKDQNTPKSMNTHLHIIEPYTNLYRIDPQPRLREAIVHCLDIFSQHIVHPKSGHFQLFFDMDWTCTSNTESYGHDVEGSWLLYEAAEVLDDKQLMDKMRHISRRLVDVTIAEGFDHKNSCFYEKTRSLIDTDKHWWPQAECLVGLTNTWRLTGEKRYLELAKQVWQYIDEHIVDRIGGEWLWRVDRSGDDVYRDSKAGFWKCPYHNTRAMIETVNLIEKYGCMFIW